jgi:hypothetical protein
MAPVVAGGRRANGQEVVAVAVVAARRQRATPSQATLIERYSPDLNMVDLRPILAAGRPKVVPRHRGEVMAGGMFTAGGAWNVGMR